MSQRSRFLPYGETADSGKEKKCRRRWSRRRARVGRGNGGLIPATRRSVDDTRRTCGTRASPRARRWRGGAGTRRQSSSSRAGLPCSRRARGPWRPRCARARPRGGDRRRAGGSCPRRRPGNGRTRSASDSCLVWPVQGQDEAADARSRGFQNLPLCCQLASTFLRDCLRADLPTNGTRNAHGVMAHNFSWCVLFEAEAEALGSSVFTWSCSCPASGASCACACSSSSRA